MEVDDPTQQQSGSAAQQLNGTAARTPQEVVDHHDVYRLAKGISPGEDIAAWEANNVRGRGARGGARGGDGGGAGGGTGTGGGR